MKPTPKLRFVERVAPIPEHGENFGKKVRILQQWWAPNGSTENEIHFELNGEWRDVPLEKEA